MKNINTHAVIATIITSFLIFKSTPTQAFPKPTFLKNVAVSLGTMTCSALMIDHTLKDYSFKIDIKTTLPENPGVIYNKPGFFKISGSIEDHEGYKINGSLSVYRLKNNPTNNDDTMFNELK